LELAGLEPFELDELLSSLALDELLLPAAGLLCVVAVVEVDAPEPERELGLEVVLELVLAAGLAAVLLAGAGEVEIFGVALGATLGLAFVAGLGLADAIGAGVAVPIGVIEGAGEAAGFDCGAEPTVALLPRYPPLLLFTLMPMPTVGCTP